MDWYQKYQIGTSSLKSVSHNSWRNHKYQEEHSLKNVSHKTWRYQKYQTEHNLKNVSHNS